jgi:hypothetical protein
MGNSLPRLRSCCFAFQSQSAKSQEGNGHRAHPIFAVFKKILSGRTRPNLDHLVGSPHNQLADLGIEPVLSTEQK